MKILYDYQAFLMQTHGGVSKCFVELIKNMPQQVYTQIGIKESDNIYLKESNIVPNLKQCSKTIENFISTSHFKGKGTLFSLLNKIPFYKSSLNINRNYSRELIKKQDYDIFHPTFFEEYYYDIIGNKPFVITIHDMTPELFPQYYKRNYYQIVNKRRLALKARHVIAVSTHTKNDIIKILGISEKKISVIYHGSPQLPYKQPTALIPEKYILYVGNRDGYKNFKLFLQSFAQITQRFPNLKLVCTGKDFNTDEIQQIKDLQIYDKVIHLFVDDIKLNNLYQHASAFIYPSLYEGFGIPILEAFANNCPVLLNNKSCFPEIAKDAAIFFELDNVHNTFVDKLTEFFNNENIIRNILIEKGHKQLQQFSWMKSAEELTNVYQSII